MRFFSALDQSREEVREGFWQLEPVHSLGEEIVVKADETGMLVFPLGWEAQSSPRVARESWGLRSSHRRAEETSPTRASSAKTRGFHTQLDEGPETP